jgi:hypothetical protein
MTTKKEPIPQLPPGLTPREEGLWVLLRLQEDLQRQKDKQAARARQLSVLRSEEAP